MENIQKSKKLIAGKKIFVIYINVGNLPEQDVIPFMEKSKSAFKEIEIFYDTILVYIPVRGETTRIETIFC